MAGGGSAGAARRLDGQGLDSLPWLAYASPEHGGRVFWMHAENGQKTWAQPQPPTAHLTEVLTASGLAAAPSAKLAARDNGLDHICWVCTHSFGSDMPECKTISGQPPSAEDMVRTIEQIAPEFLRYPSGFPSKAGLDRIIFCSRLHYGGQRRGHVPSFHSRTMYIDCQRQPKRRAVSSFHHELWHFADYTMLGRDYEFGDSEWQQLNPAGFQYGKGGAVMRSEDSTSGYIGSAQSDAFLNRYSTASAAEDKAEVWAALMTDMQLLETSPTLGHKRELLKQRSAQLLEAMRSPELWELLRAAQEEARHEDDVWEQYVTDAGRTWWFNRVTHEKRWDPPPAVAAKRPSLRERARPTHAGDGVELVHREMSASSEAPLVPCSGAEDVHSTKPLTGAPPDSPTPRRASRLPRCLRLCLGPCLPCLGPRSIEHASAEV